MHLGFRYIKLPAILIDDHTGELYDPHQQYSLAQLWTLREQHISRFLHPPYAAIIVEFYPFGRRRFKNEIQQLFKQVRGLSGNIPIFSFVREVLVPETLEGNGLNLYFCMDINSEFDLINQQSDDCVVHGH